jgi:Rps23 Pro-64 3,4-dihydroxylase Tpa1-like proline 4-hydroxylase
MSLNLSPEPFEGGALQIRETDSKKILFEIANTGLGNAVVFRVDPRLEHRVSPVAGKVPRTAFAGWFFAGECDFHTIVREEAATRAAEAPAS